MEKLAGWMIRSSSHSPELVLEHGDQHVPSKTSPVRPGTANGTNTSMHHNRHSRVQRAAVSFLGQHPTTQSPIHPETGHLSSLLICNTLADHELFTLPMISHHCHPCVTAGSPGLTALPHCPTLWLCLWVLGSQAMKEGCEGALQAHPGLQPDPHRATGECLSGKTSLPRTVSATDH